MVKPKNKTLLFAIIMLCSTIHCVGQIVTREDRFKNFGVENGLSQGSVFDIEFAPDGTFWVATAGGINYYDFNKFNVIPYGTNNKEVIAWSDIRDIAFVSPHYLLYTSRLGVGVYDLDKSKSIISYPYAGQHMVLDYNSNTNELLFYTHGDGLYVVNTVDSILKSVSRTEEPYIAENFLNYNNTHKKTYYKSNTYLNVYDGKNKKITILKQPHFSQEIVSMSQSKGRWFFLTYNSILCTDTLGYLLKEINLPKEIQIHESSQIISDNNNIWITTYGQGLFVMNYDKKTFQVFKNQSSKANSLAYNYLISITKDKQGNIYVGTNSKGFSIINETTLKFNTLNTTSEPIKLTGNFVRSILLDNQNMYVGYNDLGLDKINLTSNKVKNFQIKNGLNEEAVLNITKLGQDSILFGSYLHGLAGLINNDLNILYANKAEKPNVNSLFIDENKNIYFTSGSLIHKGKFNVKRGDFTAKPINLLDSTLNHRFLGLTLLNGFIVSFTINAVYELIPKGNYNYALSKIYDTDKRIRSISSNNNYYFIATDGGLEVVDYSFKKQQHINVDSGLSNNVVYGVLSQNDSLIWCSTNKGLNRINLNSGNIEQFSIYEGLQGDEFNTGAYSKVNDTLFIFGGMNGINIFNPANIPEKKHVRGKIRNIIINDTKTTSFFLKKQHDFSYEQNTITFEFSTDNIISNTLNGFEAQLYPNEKKWIPLLDKTSLRYANLSPGKYTFKLRSNSNLDNNFYEQYSFVIHPPYYMTWWFITLTSLVILTSLILLIRFISRYRIQQELSALKTQNKIDEERHRISRELHDNIGSQLSIITTNIESINKTIESDNVIIAQDLIQSTYHFSKNIINQLRETIWTLKSDKIFIHELIKKIQIHLNTFFSGHHVQVIVSNQIPLKYIFSPIISLTIFRVIQECANNTLKYANATIFEVRIKLINNNLIIEIYDNGKGVDQSVLANGNGLANIKYRIKEINGVTSIQSSSTSGTLIQISIPAKQLQKAL